MALLDTADMETRISPHSEGGITDKDLWLAAAADAVLRKGA